MNPASHFTAAQFALALGITKRAVLQTLGAVPSTVVASQGGEAKAWAVSALPSAWRAQLEARAPQLGCRNAEHLLQEGCKPWTLPMPIAKVAPCFLTKAASLRDALAQPLRQQHEIQGAALDELGVAEYARVFGHAITARHWRRLFERTVNRDRGREEWERLDVYIEDAAFLRKQQPPSKLEAAFNHDPLSSTMEELTDRSNPTAEDRAWVFHNAFRHFEQLSSALDNPRSQAALKASLIDYLLAALGPSFSKTPQALRRLFDRTHSRWVNGGRTLEALQDRRAVASGNFRTPDFALDHREIAKRAIQLDGNESLAHLQLREEGKLSPEFCRYYAFDARKDKSRVPKKARDLITCQVGPAVLLRHSPRALSLAGPSTARDWDDELPGDWYTADDVTWNHLFKVQKPDGSWDVLRGECLVMTDCKTDYPIEFLLIAGHYNSEHIRQLMLKAHDRVGLPRKGFLFERGTWKSKLINELKGPDAKGVLDWSRTERALEDSRLKLCIKHTYTPKGKPIEGVFGRIQEQMRCIAGFVGFNEMVEKREDIQKLIARARRGDKEALSYFPTQQEWRDIIAREFETFKNIPSNGERIPGQSPAEAWNAARLKQPLQVLAENERFLLSTHCRKVPLHGLGGIIVEIRGKRRTFANEHTGAWYHAGVKDVLAYYNLEQPELLTVSDLSRENFFTVKELRLPALSATPQQLADVAKAKRDHLAPARAIFGEIKHEVVSTYSRDCENEQTKDLGDFHNQATKQHKAAESEVQKVRRRINTLCDELGRPRPDYNTLRMSLPAKLDSLLWEMESRNKTAPVTSTP